jgi:hypothetical protein
VAVPQQHPRFDHRSRRREQSRRAAPVVRRGALAAAARRTSRAGCSPSARAGCSRLPKEKILLEADGYNPGAANATPPNPPSPYTLSLVDNVQRLKLDVQRVVPVHYPADNRVVTMAELTKWVGRNSTN